VVLPLLLIQLVQPLLIGYGDGVEPEPGPKGGPGRGSKRVLLLCTANREAAEVGGGWEAESVGSHPLTWRPEGWAA